VGRKLQVPASSAPQPDFLQYSLAAHLSLPEHGWFSVMDSEVAPAPLLVAPPSALLPALAPPKAAPPFIGP
jgi:hypothetical protein